jgi:hypothetical protein
MFNYTSYSKFVNNRISTSSYPYDVEEYLYSKNIYSFTILFNNKLTIQVNDPLPLDFINDLVDFFKHPLSNIELLILQEHVDYLAKRDEILQQPITPFNNPLYHYETFLQNSFNNHKSSQACDAREKRFHQLVNFILIPELYLYKNLYITEVVNVDLFNIINNSIHSDENKNRIKNIILIGINQT